jgi:hypothetical protein
MKTADEIGAGIGPAIADDAWEWDTDGEESSSAEEATAADAVAIAVQTAVARASKGKSNDIAGLGDALTKKQLREVKKAINKATSKVSGKADDHSSSSDDDELTDVPVEVVKDEIATEEAKFMASAEKAVKAVEAVAKKEAGWASFGAWRTSAPKAPEATPGAVACTKPVAKEAWIDAI